MIRQPLIAFRLPALGVGAAAVTLVGIVIFNRPAPVATLALAPIPTDTLHRHVALAASNPFDDPVAATLEAHAANSDSGAASDVE